MQITIFDLVGKVNHQSRATSGDLVVNPVDGAIAAYKRDFEGQLSAGDIEVYTVDLEGLKDCIGCWNCWVKTPGRCVFSDQMGEVYKRIIHSDRALFILPTKQGFIEGSAKTFIDRLIPLFHPYIVINNGEMMHLERYDKFSIIEYYFEGEAASGLDGCSAEEDAVIEDYLCRTSYHFRQEGVRLMYGSWERKVLKPRMPKEDLSTKVQTFDPSIDKKYIVYNGSPRGKKGNSLRIANQIIEGLKEAGISDGDIVLRHLIHQDQHVAWAQNFSETASHIFVLPLYVHSMPGIVKKYFDLLPTFKGDDLYRPQMSFFVQSGFMGAFQSQYLRAYLARLPERLNCLYGGTLIRAGMEIGRAHV